MQNIAATAYFDNNLPTQITCDASLDGLAAALEQCDVLNTDWKPIAFPSRVLNTAEKKYATNKLHVLAIVWATAHYRNFISGQYFTIITDHQALLSGLKPNWGKTTYFSRLTRWVNKLLPFDFDINHKPWSKMQIVDYLSRCPTEEATPISHYE